MNNLELTGRIIEIHTPNKGVSQRTGNAWMTQEYVLETEDQYPRKVPFEIFGEDRIRQFSIQMYERVTIQFNVEGNEYNGRWYVKVKCYNVVRQQEQKEEVYEQPAPAAQPLFAEQQQPQNDDLPF